MPYVTCKKCGAKVSDQYSNCTICQTPFTTLQESNAESHRVSDWLDRPMDQTRQGQSLSSWLGGHIQLLIIVGVLSFISFFLIVHFQIFGASTSLYILVVSSIFLASDFIPITKTHLERVMTIHAPKEKVLGLDADYRKWTECNPQIKSVQLLSEQGNIQIFKVNLTKGGKYQEIQQIFSDRVESTVNMMRIKLRQVHYYETVAEGTRVTVKVDLTHRGIWGKFKLANRAEANMQTVLTAQKRIAESS